MSTPRSEQRKSARFNKESFDQEWQKLQDAADAAKAKGKPVIPKLELRDINGSDSPKKTQDQSTWKSSQSDRSADSAKTQTQTITTTQTTTTTQTDPMAHTAPVITPRKQTRFAPETSSDGGPSQEKTSARSEKAVDGPRRTKIRSREPVQSKRSGSPSVSTTTTPSSSPVGTPREKDQFESPRSLKANQFRKRVSKQLSKVALDLSKINEKLTPRRNSPPPSPGSAGRVSPSKMTPRKKESAFIKGLSLEVRNSAAKCFIELQKQGNFQKPFSIRANILLKGGMIGILSGRGIEYDSKNLEELVADAELRSANHMFDFKINLSNTSYKKDVDKMAEAFVTSWEKNYVSADYHAAPDADKNIARENFLPLFVKDYFRGVKHELLLPDGTTRPFESLEEIANFLNKNGKGSHRSKYISNVVCQNFSAAAINFAVGGYPGYVSNIKIYDGTPLVARGETKQRYIYSMDDGGVISVKSIITLRASGKENSPRVQSQLQFNETRSGIYIDDDAFLTVESDLMFEPNDEWSISDLHVRGQGWNLPDERL
jgi:hypothetical protein